MASIPAAAPAIHAPRKIRKVVNGGTGSGNTMAKAPSCLLSCGTV
jgi:hypothetical protein